ncbi:MAG: HAD-IA family hydrolase [Thermoanaerobaculia bacterium]
MKLELVVSDVAGTTVAAADDVGRVFRETFAAIEIHLPSTTVDAVRGRSKRQAIRDLVGSEVESKVGSADPDAIYQEFLRRLILASGDWQPVPGARETLEWLAQRGIKVALTTGLDRVILERLLERLGWSAIVDAALGADDVERGRPAPDLILRAMELCGVADPRSVLVVGDTAADLEAARNAGAGWSIGVLSGAHTRQRLVDCPHSAILTSVADLPEWIRRGNEPISTTTGSRSTP